MKKQIPPNDGPQDIDRAMVAVLMCYASGMDGKSIFKMGNAGIPESGVPAGIITKDLVERIGRFQEFYLEAFRRGWQDTGFPKADKIAVEFFAGNLDDTYMAVSMFQHWLKAALPKDRLDFFMIEGAKLLAEGFTHDEVSIGFESNLPEPKKTIVVAYWNSRARAQLHNER